MPSTIESAIPAAASPADAAVQDRLYEQVASEFAAPLARLARAQQETDALDSL